MDKAKTLLFVCFAGMVESSSLSSKRKKAILSRTRILWEDPWDEEEKIRQAEYFLLKMLSEGFEEKFLALYSLSKAPWIQVSTAKKIKEFKLDASEPVNKVIASQVTSMTPLRATITR
jgi:hypothetical protein